MLPRAPESTLFPYTTLFRSHSLREVIASLAALAFVPVATIAPFVLADPRAFWSDTVLYTNGGVADAYPIAGYGFGEFLYQDRKSTRLNSSHPSISYAVFCLK